MISGRVITRRAASGLLQSLISVSDAENRHPDTCPHWLELAEKGKMKYIWGLARELPAGLRY